MGEGVSFIVLGGLLLAGLLADALGRRTRIPRVTLLLVLGVLAGQEALSLIPDAALGWYEPLSIVALTMVAFLLGQALRHDRLAARGRAILMTSGAIVLGTVGIMALGLMALGQPPELALLLGAIATATDPAATEDTLQEARATGPFADTIRGIVAVDDAWGIMMFALVLVVAEGMASGGWSATYLLEALYDIGGALLLGLAIGWPAAVLTGKLRDGDPTQLEALALVFLTAGLALWLEVSYLLAAMAAGVVIANRAPHPERPFREVQRFERPFLILFFLLAGAQMAPETLLALGPLGVAYVALRIAARVVSGWLGGGAGGLKGAERLWIGPALLPQAGVAVGMALVAAHALPEHGETIVSLAIGTTVVFELVGPLVTMIALRKVGVSRS